MDKKTKSHILGYKQDIQETIELFKIIINELEDIINKEQISIDNLSDYPQFEDKMIDLECLYDQLTDLRDKFEEGIASMGEADAILDSI